MKMIKHLAEVVCDNCGWSLKEQDIMSWHNVECPACKISVIISDADTDLWNTILSLREAGMIKVKEDPDFLDSSGTLIRIDTNLLRK